MWVDWSQQSLLVAFGAITFNPLAWNIVARNEYRNKTITRLFGGNPYYGCYFLALMIFGFGLFRDSLYHKALFDQPQLQLLPYPLSLVVPAVLFLTGQTLVITSTYALGVTGTFLGDYFGILMDHRVEGFPFNVARDPMYTGSTLSFAATALWYQRPAGLLVTLYVYVVYVIALRYEGPFTDMIYSSRATSSSQAGNSKKKDL